MKTEIWNDGLYRKVNKYLLVDGTHKYHIIFLDDVIDIYEEDMLNMCQAILDDAKNEREQTPEIAPCPFCQNECVEHYFGESKLFVILCRECDYTSGGYKCAAEAIRLHNAIRRV